MSGDNDQIQRMQSLLQDFEPMLKALKDERRRAGSRFNVAEAFGVDRNELAHSRFIAYLLDPTERHDLGIYFLTSFLDFLGLKFDSASWQGAWVKTEAWLDSDSRIDIYIRLGNGQIILIENKVGALEDHCQIACYQDWLQCQDAPAVFPHQLVFLTPEGRPPVSTRRPEEVICLSYLQLADWIFSSHQVIEAQRLRIILEQYAEICRQIGGAMRRNVMPDAIRQFFLDLDAPARLEAALEIERHLPDFKRWLYETFCQNVGKKLTERLRANGHDKQWEVRFDDNLIRKWGGFRITYRNGGGCFSVRVESSWGTSWERSFFGVARAHNRPQKLLQPQDKALMQRLKAGGLTKVGNDWTAYRFFHDLDPGLPQFDPSCADDVRKLYREMQDNDRPLTRQVVDVIWNLFCSCRADLEDLNNNCPYCHMTRP